jgi:hypothetical protein
MDDIADRTLGAHGDVWKGRHCLASFECGVAILTDPSNLTHSIEVVLSRNDRKETDSS